MINYYNILKRKKPNKWGFVKRSIIGLYIINYSTYKDVYTYYKSIQDELVNNVSGAVKKALTKVKKENEDEELKKLAMELALKANIYKTLSEKIITLLDQKKTEEIEKIKKDLLK